MLRTFDELYREELLRIFYQSGEKTDRSEAIRMEVLKVLAETIEPSKKYDILRAAYFQLISEGSGFRDSARTLLISKFAEKTNDLKLDLLKFARESDSKVKEHVARELVNLP